VPGSRIVLGATVSVVAVALIAGCGFAHNAAPTPAASRHPPVVFISFDEFSTTSLVDARGRIDAVRYPNFAKLASDADWFPYATAPADETPRAMGALLTGNLPPRTAKPTYRQMPNNLFTFLGSRYRIDASEEVTSLCPKRLCPRTRTQSRRSVLHELAQGRPERFERWTRSIRATRQPTFYFKHVLMPHAPWRYLPSGQQFVSGPEPIPGWGHAFSSRWVSIQKYQRHLLQLGYVDRLLGSVIDRLKSQGMYDEAIIVVTADNGESFGRVDNGHEISARNFGDIALTPLIIKRSHQGHGTMPERHVRSEDVVPTLAGLVHLKIPSRVGGHSVYGPSARLIPSGTVVYQRSGRRFALTGPGLRDWAATAQQLKARLFGSGDDGPGLYGIGPYRSLVGRPVTQLDPHPAGATRATLNDARAFRAVRPASEFLPCYITGRLTRGTGRTPLAVAVAVNGRIAGTSPTFRTGAGGPHFYAAMVPPAALHAGANRVQLFSVGGTRAKPRLREIG
jgi:hypothetical protein